MQASSSHTFTFNSATTEAVFLRYPVNYEGVMTNSCSSPQGQCLSFPQQRGLLLLPTLPTTLSSVTLTNMINGMYVSPVDDNFTLTVASSGAVDYYEVPHNNLTVLLNNPTTTLPHSMTITTPQNLGEFVRNLPLTTTVTAQGLFSFIYHCFLPNRSK